MRLPFFLSFIIPCWAITIDVNDPQQLQAAASASLSNLLSLYNPNLDGVYPQAATAWFASGMIWDTFYKYSAYTGDKQFDDMVTAALANVSFGSTADILGGAASALQGLSGKWNDDIGWQALAIQTGAEIYGPGNTMPGIGKNDWSIVPAKTLWQMHDQASIDNECGGGIYWSRNRLDPQRKLWKSAITNWEFTHLSARAYMDTKNQTILDLANNIWQWIFDAGLADANTGVLHDGVNAGACVPSTTQWSYTCSLSPTSCLADMMADSIRVTDGQALSTCAWMYKATGTATFLTTGRNILNAALAEFAPNNIMTEATCEATISCNRDQQHFKSTFLRNMVDFYRVTDSNQDKQKIRAVISGTIDAMAPTCNSQHICSGNWTNPEAMQAHYYPADLHASSSLLVAALGVYTETTGSDLIPDNQATTSNSDSNFQGDNNDSAGFHFRPISIHIILLTVTVLSCFVWAL